MRYEREAPATGSNWVCDTSGSGAGGRDVYLAGTAQILNGSPMGYPHGYCWKLIGERWIKVETVTSEGHVSVSEQKRRWIEPAAFTTLKRGGPKNNFRVQAVCYNGGNEFVKPNPDDPKNPHRNPFEFFTFTQIK